VLKNKGISSVKTSARSKERVDELFSKKRKRVEDELEGRIASESKTK